MNEGETKKSESPTVVEPITCIQVGISNPAFSLGIFPTKLAEDLIRASYCAIVNLKTGSSVRASYNRVQRGQSCKDELAALAQVSSSKVSA